MHRVRDTLYFHCSLRLDSVLPENRLFGRGVRDTLYFHCSLRLDSVLPENRLFGRGARVHFPNSGWQSSLRQRAFNLTLGRTGRGRGVGCHPSEVFLSFSLEDKTLAPDGFSSCSFIPRANFETSSVMVSCYIYEI